MLDRGASFISVGQPKDDCLFEVGDHGVGVVMLMHSVCIPRYIVCCIPCYVPRCILCCIPCYVPCCITCYVPCCITCCMLCVDGSGIANKTELMDLRKQKLLILGNNQTCCSGSCTIVIFLCFTNFTTWSLLTCCSATAMMPAIPSH